jgi:hypothetical protein
MGICIAEHADRQRVWQGLAGAGENPQRLAITTIWDAPGQSGVWQDNRRLTGNVESDLKPFFGVHAITGGLIVNSIGGRGWEPFSIDYQPISDNQKRYLYYFRRCTKSE